MLVVDNSVAMFDFDSTFQSRTLDSIPLIMTFHRQISQEHLLFETRNFIPKASTWQVLTHPAGNHVYNSHEMEIDLNRLGDVL